MAYFPMFVDLTNADCLIVGGGIVALRKVQVLLDFDAKVTVIAPEICEEIKAMETVKIIEREVIETDYLSRVIVIAATNDLNVNHEIATLCKQRNIPVNAVDQIEDCSFIFPSYVKEQNVVAAVSSSGKSPVITQYIKHEIQSFLTEEIGELAEFLGELRPRVKQQIVTEALRKKVYGELLQDALHNHHMPEEAVVEKIIRKYKNSDAVESMK